MAGRRQSTKKPESFAADTLKAFRASQLPQDQDVDGIPAHLYAVLTKHRGAVLDYLLGPDEAPAEPRVRIPRLTLHSLPRYIPAVSKALERGQVTSNEAKAMLYAAQMLVAAYRALGDADETMPPAKRIGFSQAAAEAVADEVNPTGTFLPPNDLEVSTCPRH